MRQTSGLDELTIDEVVAGYLRADGNWRRRYLRHLATLDPASVAEAVERSLRAAASVAAYNGAAKLALKLGTHEANEALLREAQTQRRFEGTAVRVFGRSSHPRREEVLLEALAGRRKRAARSAVEAMVERPAPLFIIPLCRAALGEIPSGAHARAAGALHQLGGHPALARVLLSQTGRAPSALLADLETMVRVKIRISLFGFNLQRFLEREAADKGSGVREQATAVLRAINDRATLLRPASGGAATLLRPVESAAAGPDDHLLRPATADGALEE